ncbi:hypothetical protein [Clostridium mucosae]|uniref:hypothetical protein n=1 Tax=Clostridium sp. DSM 100503 TaxID=2963282 RepID=UPI0027D45178|nr:hypothetical protein [Clostridium sp. DSM 100503]
MISILKYVTLIVDRSYFREVSDFMEMKFEILPSYSIAYIRQVGPYGEDNMQVMEEIKTFARNENLLDDEAIVLGLHRTTLKKLNRKSADIIHV